PTHIQPSSPWQAIQALTRKTLSWSTCAPCTMSPETQAPPSGIPLQLFCCGRHPAPIPKRLGREVLSRGSTPYGVECARNSRNISLQRGILKCSSRDSAFIHAPQCLEGTCPQPVACHQPDLGKIFEHE